MINTKKFLILVLAFPIAALFVLMIQKGLVVSSGNQVTLPIKGYDPRDLLSGNYMIYQIDYGVSDLCQNQPAEAVPAYICLDTKEFSFVRDLKCSQLIRGTCNGFRFKAGIEKFYIPETEAAKLEKKLQAGGASVILSLTSTGDTQVKDLLIDGVSWKEQP